MKHKHTKMCLAWLFGLNLTAVHAQEAATVAGGDASGSGGTASYSVGQVLYSSNASGTGSVAEGVQQAFEISIVTSLNETKGMDLQLAVYPNPASEQLTLTTAKDGANLSYELFDIKGKLLAADRINNRQVFISMSLYPAATYFVKVSEGSKVVKTFKITKN